MMFSLMASPLAEVFMLSITLTHSIDINFIAFIYLHEVIPNVSTLNKSSIHTHNTSIN